MTDYAYDPDLPYVVVTDGNEKAARFRLREDAERYEESVMYCKVIDTTPKPRLPEDAKFITWTARGDRWFAERTSNGWEVAGYGLVSAIENVLDVTPDTVFTVLDEREN